MLTRREFLKLLSFAAGTSLLSPTFAKSTSNNYFALNSIIEDNPNAVFIMKTNIDEKTNSQAIKQAALDFGKSVFQQTNDPEKGIPLTHLFPIKPNLTSWQWDSPENFEFEDVMGAITDVNFVEGIIESMNDAGVESKQIYLRDANGPENLEYAGYGAMTERNNIDIKLREENPKVVWADVPDGTYFSKLPYLWPYNAPDSWLLNIAKFKAHTMGMTLCSKNLQGTIPIPYVKHCWDWGKHLDIDEQHIQPNAFDNISDNYIRHNNNGIPRWNIESNSVVGGLGMETWVSRCIDNNRTIKPGLNVIEGIYGRDGNGFYKGPDGKGTDHMTNLIIFGKNSFYVDIIGTWLGGHEPGNFGLFHLAKEHGLIDFIDPNQIPVFDWDKNGNATESSLKDFDRYEIVTSYMGKEGEEFWHLVNEPFDYSTTSIDPNTSKKPETFILKQNYPNPFNNATTIEFQLKENSKVTLEIFNSRGQLINKLVDEFLSQGNYKRIWSNHSIPSGTYFYRIKTKSFSEMKKMVLLK